MTQAGNGEKPAERRQAGEMAEKEKTAKKEKEEKNAKAEKSGKTEKSERALKERVKAAKKLQKDLVWKFPHIARKSPEQKEAAFSYCEGYKEFLNEAKTEREFVTAAVKRLEKAGFVPYERTGLKTGDRVYEVNRGKALIFATAGRRPLEEGIRLNAAHIDSPRLDLKPNPLYEKNGLAYFKTHYYGGLRKYQWTAIPMAMHGVVVKKDGETVTISVGEKEGEPVFCVTDLLPHLAAQQNERKLRDGIRGEELNIVVGSLPYDCGGEEELKEPVKLLALSILNERYGMTERDFLRAEIEMVPAFQAADVGLDGSMVGAYGQDDRVCAYTALTAGIEVEGPEYTTVTILADKEEVGSLGNTGLDSDYLLHFIQDLAEDCGADWRRVLRRSLALSSDVNAAFDPTFPGVYEEHNSCYLNRGCVLTKYTGARGKSGSNDASAETMAQVIDIMEEAGVCWQAGELGAVDAGGGGTVASCLSCLNVDTVDLGVPVLSMHSPFELTAKLDIYQTYLAFCAFYR